MENVGIRLRAYSLGVLEHGDEGLLVLGQLLLDFLPCRGAVLVLHAHVGVDGPVQRLLVLLGDLDPGPAEDVLHVPEVTRQARYTG